MLHSSQCKIETAKETRVRISKAKYCINRFIKYKKLKCMSVPEVCVFPHNHICNRKVKKRTWGKFKPIEVDSHINNRKNIFKPQILEIKGYVS